MVTGDKCTEIKYWNNYFFVECAGVRMLPFTPVVEKNNTRGRAKSWHPDFQETAGTSRVFLLSVDAIAFPQLWKTLWKKSGW